MADHACGEIRPFRRSWSRYGSESEDLTEADSGSGEEDQPVNRCVRLKLPQNITAYLEKSDLNRDYEPISCDSSIVEKVVSNYIIAKRILSNLCWRDKFICKQVCTTWRSAINTLAREQLNPVDFVYDLLRHPFAHTNTFKKSDDFYNEPLAVLNFVNTPALNTALECGDVSPCLCQPPCDDKWHCMMDVIQQQVCAPKNCMLTVVASYLMYCPLEQSETDKSSLNRPYSETPFFSGIYIPVIPDVKFHVLNIRQRNKNTMDLQTDFYDEVDRISQTQIIKGALVFVTEKYVLQSVEDIVFLNYLKDIQPDIPYALGGCIVEETMFDEKEMDTLISRINSKVDFVSENLISIGLFTIPKNVDTSSQRDKCNFEIYSVVIESSDWTKQKIQQTISEFASKVPRFEYSVALKLSCVGRDKKHLLEQDYFRAAFPQTPILGCYGNGELGINHPPRAPPAQPTYRSKRPKTTSETQGLMYSYSTVFVYIGWGKITTPAEQMQSEGSKKAV